ncbi:hypothetical protein LshimejAT787_1500320 [Lyophyllum shimeji]|uniref:CCHC-type domain-containing protein n=1 Tax=Lyophyllum shimeji TaxID=47721 RepID=A0A9P3PYF1_LYOSH|nr:hypothetical protein LshimejAT787_1500320 [Lyophyllum shimeji]
MRHDPGPTPVQSAAAAQGPAHAAPSSAQPTLRSGDRLRPAPPDSFDREREKGHAFINSCDLYMSLTPNAFPDEQTHINWALSYLKSSCAARFATRTVHAPSSQRSRWGPPFPDEKRKAATTFETSAYHQGSCSVDKYIDEFLDLVEESQFPDGAQLVSRFHHGLDSRVEAKWMDALQTSTFTSGSRQRSWSIEAARLVNYNNHANQDFRSAVTKARMTPAPPPVAQNSGVSAFCALPAPPLCPAAAVPAAPAAPVARPLPPGIPMDIDLSHQNSGTPIICCRCKKPGHSAHNCPDQFDICSHDGR